MSDAMAQRPHVLMLVSGFPPARQVIIRSVKFAKYLPEYGWGPVVVTPFAKTGAEVESHWETPEGTLVKRTLQLPTLSVIATSILRSRSAGVSLQGRGAVPGKIAQAASCV